MKKILIVFLLFFLTIAINGKISFSDSIKFYDSKPLTEKEFKRIIENKMGNNKIDISFMPESDEYILKEEISATIVDLIELLGERKKPILYTFYKDNISDLEYAKKIYQDKLIYSYFKGILSLNGNNEIGPKEKVPYQDGLSIADRIFNPTMRLKSILIKLSEIEKINIKNINFNDNLFFSGSEITYEIEFQDKFIENKYLWIGFSIIDSNGKIYDVPAKKIYFENEILKKEQLKFKIPNNILSGKYHSIISVWDRVPNGKDAIRLTAWESEKDFLVFNRVEEFEKIPSNIWKITEGKLGRSYLKRNNVYTNNSILNIIIPGNTTNGGEISTIQRKSFGAYEIRMKVPHVESSITGFFLYKSPDYYHEIDIEIVNNTSGEFWLTTYSDGGKNNILIDNFGIDFSEDFHDFRIEYYNDYISFYIDNIFIKKWVSGYSKNPMYLLLNSWFPSWMDGIKADSNKNLQVEWIRY